MFLRSRDARIPRKKWRDTVFEFLGDCMILPGQADTNESVVV